MNNANIIDIALVAALSTVVVAGLVTVGMTSALISGAVTGAVACSAYLLTK